MADEDFNSVLSGVKDAAQTQNSAPPIEQVAAPTQSADTGLSGVLQNVKEMAHPDTPQAQRQKSDIDKEIVEHQKQQKAYDEYQESQKPSELGQVAKALLPGNPFANLTNPEGQAKEANDFFKQTMTGRIADAFGHGAFEAAGTAATELLHPFSDGEYAAIDSMNKVTVQKIGEGNFVGNINMGLLNLVSTLPSGIISAIGQIGTETDNKFLESIPAAMSDPNLIGGLPALFHGITPHVSEDAIRQFVTKPPLPPEVARAVSNGIIQPSNWDTYTEAEQAIIDRTKRMEAQKGLIDTTGMTEDQKKAAMIANQKELVNTEQGPSIHDIARTIEPELFNERDRLETRQLVLRESFNNPEDAFSNEYDEKLADLKKQQVESTRVPVGLEGDELQKAVEESQRKGAEIDKQIKDFGTKADYIKNEAEKARQEFQTNDYQLRDLAADPRSKAAYDKAQEMLRAWQPPEAVAPEAPKETVPIPAPSVIIADDYTKRAIAAGRPESEAKASSAIVQAYYEQLAKDLGNGKTADQLYQENTPTINKSASKSTTIKGGYDRIKNTIKLMATADASTLMHEELHGWLEQRMRYATEEGTSQRLKDDMAALREWAGFKDKKPETPAEKAAYIKAHEKVADAWERYLQEGIAPSKALGQIFAQFKEWLGNLYNAAKRGNYKIDDNIRAIFDRMLAENPERTIVAVDEPGKSASNIHAVHAALSPPEGKDAAADKVAKEVDAVAKTHDKEIADAIKAAETGKIPKPAKSRAKSANAGQPTGEAGTAEELAKVPPVRSESEAGGTGTRTESRPRLPVPEATAGEPAIIGKDGKVNTSSIDKIGHQEFLKRFNAELLRAEQNGTAKKMFSFEDPVKLADLKAIAEQMNMTVDQMKNIQTDYGSLTERPILRAGAYILMKQLHEDMMAAAKDAISSGKSENMAEFLKTYDKREELLNAYKTTESLSKEAGVHLVASKIIEAIDVTGAKETGSILYQMEQLERDGKASGNGLTKEDLDKVTQLANMIGKSDNTVDVANILKNANKPTLWDKFKEVEVVALTSGLITHTSYALGLIPLNLFKSLLDDTFTAIADKVRGALGFETSGERLTQGLRGIFDQIVAAPNTLLNTGTAIREGKTILLPREQFKTKSDLFNNLRKTTAIDPEMAKKLVAINFKEDKFEDLVALRDKFNEAVKDGDVMAAGRLQTKLEVETARKKAILEKHFTAEMQSRLKTWGEVYTASKDFWLSQGTGLKAMMQEQKSGTTSDPFYSALKRETQSVYGGIHTFQRMSISAGELRAECRRYVVAEANKRGEDLSYKEIDARTDALIPNAPQEVWDKVTKTANEWSFMNSNSQYGKTLTAWLENVNPFGIPVGKFIAPITTVPINIKIWTMDHTPGVGMARAAFRDDMMGRNGIAAQNRAIGKQLSGVAALGMFYMFAQNKMNTPSHSSIKGHDEQKIDAGEPPNSIRVGDWWVNIEPLAGISALAGLGADAYFLRNIALGKDESETMNHAITNAITNYALREDALVNLAQLVDAAQGRGAGIENFLNNMGSSISVPALVSQLNEDPYQREAKTLIDKLKSKVQETSETLAPKINPITGEILKRREGWIPGTRFYEGSTKVDPIAAQLTAINLHPANPHPNINGVDLSPQQGAEYSSVKGHILNNGMQVLMQGDGKEDFDEADTQGKRKMAIKVETHASQCAKSYMFNKYPELLKDANDKYEASCRNEIE